MSSCYLYSIKKKYTQKYKQTNSKQRFLFIQANNDKKATLTIHWTTLKCLQNGQCSSIIILAVINLVLFSMEVLQAKQNWNIALFLISDSK